MTSDKAVLEKQRSEDDINRMTEGSIFGKMLRFTVPLLIGNLFQQLYNTADALIVGRMLGDNALASVTSTGSLSFLMISFFVGLSSGAGVVVSRYFGAKDEENLKKSVHTCIALYLIAGVFVSVLGVCLTPLMLHLMDTPESVIEGAISYTRIYFAGGIGLVMYNGCRSTMQAVGDSKHPLYYLIVSSLLNIVLDICFIAFFGGGVGSAALATILSQLVSVVLCMRRLMTTENSYKIVPSQIRLDWRITKLAIKYGLPSGLQSSVISIANVVVQSNINAFGEFAVAGCGAYSKIEGFAFVPVNAITIAITTFVGQNLGAGEYDRAKKGGWLGMLFCVVFSELIGLLLYIIAPWVITMFTNNPESVQFGVIKCRICSVFYFALAASHCSAAILRGAGKSVIPMAIMLSIWCVFRVSFLKIAVPIWNTINTVNWVYPITWCMSLIVFIIYLLKADWVHGFLPKSR